MIVLAIDLSSPQAGIALLENDRTLASRTWPLPRGGGQDLVGQIRILLKEADIAITAIDLFAAGRGPGNYSGMRAAITTAESLALPAGNPVVAVSTGLTMAAQLITEKQLAYVTIVGDARRDTFWSAGFTAGPNGIPTQEKQWNLLTQNELQDLLASGSAVGSWESERLALFLPQEKCHNHLHLNELPNPVWTARLALLTHQGLIPAEPLTPIYLHPAVMVR